MLLTFKTARNTYGHRKYLAIDTGAEIFSRNSPCMVVDGIEIKAKDYKELIEKLKRSGFKEVEQTF